MGIPNHLFDRYPNRDLGSLCSLHGGDYTVEELESSACLGAPVLAALNGIAAAPRVLEGVDVYVQLM